MLSIHGFGWFPLVCFFFFNFLWGGAVFTVEYKSNVYVFEHPNILSDILQWFWDNTLWLKLNGFLILCLGVSWSASTYKVDVIYSQCCLSKVLDGLFVFFSNFFWGVGWGFGAVFADEYNSNVYVFENKNVLSDILCWFWDNTLWLKLNGFLILCLGVS